MHDGKHQARQRPLAVEVDGASAALPVIAAFFGAGQAQLLAQRVEHRRARIGRDSIFLAVHSQQVRCRIGIGSGYFHKLNIHCGGVFRSNRMIVKRSKLGRE